MNILLTRKSFSRRLIMAKRLITAFMLFSFVFTTLSACAEKRHVPPGQIKKQFAPDQQKKK